MKFVALEEIIAPIEAQYKKLYVTYSLIPPEVWLQAILDYINELGNRFVGVVFDEEERYGGYLVFEETKDKWKYEILYGIKDCLAPHPDDYTNVKDKNLHATVHFFNLSLRPIYFIGEKIASTRKTKAQEMGSAKGTTKK